MNPFIALAVYLTSTLADVAWVRWTIHSNKLHTFRATTWSGLIAFFGVFGTVHYVDNHWYSISLIAGCMTGTAIAVEQAKRKERRAGRPLPS